MAIAYDIEGGPFWATSPLIWFQSYRTFNGYSRFRLKRIVDTSRLNDNSNWELRVGLHNGDDQVTQSLSLRKENLGNWYNFRRTDGGLHHPTGARLAVIARFIPDQHYGYGRIFIGDLEYSN